MKELIIAFTLVLLSGVAFGQEKTDIEKEKEAIIAVIEKQHNAFRVRDYEAVASTFVKDAPVIRYTASKSGFLYQEYEDPSAYKSYFESNPTPVPYTSQFKNYKIKVYEKSAWAAFDLHKSNGNHEINVRFLEKLDGEWKIVFFSFINASSYDEEVEEGDE